MENLRGWGSEQNKFSVFFLNKIIFIGGEGGGGGKGTGTPFPGGLYIVNYWKSTNNLCIQGLLKFSRLGFEVADDFFISISFEF